MLSTREAWVQSQFRESKDIHGKLTFLSFRDRLKEVEDMALVKLADRKEYKIRDIYGV